MLFPDRLHEKQLSRIIPSLAGCAMAAALALSAAPALAGCNSGNAGSSVVLSQPGCQANAAGMDSTAVGAAADAAESGTTVGAYSTSSIRSSAFGARAKAIGENSTAIGYRAGWHIPAQPKPRPTGYIALGAWTGVNQPLGRYSTTIGASNGNGGPKPHAAGNYAIAIGGGDGTTDNLGARAAGNYAAAIGTDTVAQGLRSLALGAGARATASWAVAIGSNSEATVPNTVSVGSGRAYRRIVNVANAVNANDAVTLGQVQAMVGAGSASAPARVTQAQPTDDLRQELAELRALVKQQQGRIAQLERRAVVAGVGD